jgi:hypothetical protein
MQVSDYIKNLLLITCSLLIVACSSNPYGINKHQGYFLGQATVTSNVSNICSDTQGRYALKGTQQWLAGGEGDSWYTCSTQRSLNYSPDYVVYYSIIKNDGTGNSIVTQCKPTYQATNNNLFNQIDLNIQLNASTPTCQMKLSYGK